MKNLLLGLAALPFLASVASAAELLNDAQMDQITAGISLSLPSFPPLICPSCMSSTSSVTSVNGVTTGTGGALPTVTFDTFVAAFVAQLIANKFP